MRRVPDLAKRRIVEHLACYQTDGAVVQLIKEEFGVSLTPRHVRAYDPRSLQFAASCQWVDYFHIVRDRFKAEAGQIGIAHKAYRLMQLQTLFMTALDRGDLRRAASMLEQAAKEVGNFYVKPRF